MAPLVPAHNHAMTSLPGWRLRAEIPALASIAVVTVAARLPFLIRGDRFFDSDEAVEGLMALHVLSGEHPLFLWGQRYKGVPEVYLSSLVFRVTEPSVFALKAVTLACFAAFVCLNFILLSRVCSRRVSWMATSLLVVCPPSLVLWSLSGSAEIVMTMVAGTVLCLGVHAWRRSGSSAGLIVAAVGFGLWVQQYVVYYVVALALAALVEVPEWRTWAGEALAGRALPAWLRVARGVVAAIAALYIALGLIAFVGGGFEADLSGVKVSATHPQKMWWISAGLLAAAGLATVVHDVRRINPAVVAAFLIGYSPAIVGRFTAHGFGSPTPRMDLADLGASMGSSVGDFVPMLFGFKSPTTAWLGVPAATAILFAAAVALSYWRMRERPFTVFFHAFLVVTPALFFISGSFVDAQSYRYLMPMYAALPVVYAVGVDAAFAVSRIAGALLLAGLLAVCGWQQAAWYRLLEPDRAAAALIQCLDRSGIRAAYADYWVSYKLTFLTRERIVVVPTSGDRYEPLAARVRAVPSAPTGRAPCERLEWVVRSMTFRAGIHTFAPH